MAGRTSAHRRRIWLIVLSAMLIVAVGVIVVFRFVIDDNASAVPLSDALQRYRTEVSASSVPPTTAPATIAAATTTAVASEPPPMSPLPTVVEPGIYRYRTTGQESVDALRGATHAYPAETTITVTPDGCGVLLRWDALRERRDEWRLCATARGIGLQPVGLQYHEFYSQSEFEDVRCETSVVVVPIDSKPLAAVSQSCTLGSDPWMPSWEVIGDERRDVGGTSVAVTHVKMTVADDDEYGERTTIDWYLDRHGLPVEVRGTKHSTSPSPIGSVRYDEHYTLELESLTPLQ